MFIEKSRLNDKIIKYDIGKIIDGTYLIEAIESMETNDYKRCFRAALKSIKG